MWDTRHPGGSRAVPPSVHQDVGRRQATVRAYEAGAVVGIKSDNSYVRHNAKIDGFNSSPEGRLNSNLKCSGKLTRPEPRLDGDNDGGLRG